MTVTTEEIIWQNEVLEMARQAGYFLYDLTETHQKKTVETDEEDEWAQLEAFAKLIAAKERADEREACAKELEEYAKRHRNLRAKGMTDLDYCVVYTLETNAYLLRTRFYEKHAIRARAKADRGEA